MPKADEPNDEALKSLDARLAALEAKRAKKAVVSSEQGATEGYRVLADLIGGVLGGFGLGWLLDRYAGTEPFGVIGGVLIGVGLSVFIVVRRASRMSEKAAAASAAQDDDGAGKSGPTAGDA